MKETPIIKRRALLSGAAAFMAGVFTSRAESAIASHDPSSEPCDDPFCLEHTNETGATTTWDHVGTSTALVLTAPGEALRVNGRTVNVNVSQQFRAASSGSAGSSSLSALAHTDGANVEAFASGPNGGAGLGVSSDSSGASVGASSSGPDGFSGFNVSQHGASILSSHEIHFNAPRIASTFDYISLTPNGSSDPLVSFDSSNVSIVGDLRINGDLTALTATATNVIADTGQFTKLSFEELNLPGSLVVLADDILLSSNPNGPPALDASGGSTRLDGDSVEIGSGGEIILRGGDIRFFLEDDTTPVINVKARDGEPDVVRFESDVDLLGYTFTTSHFRGDTGQFISLTTDDSIARGMSILDLDGGSDPAFEAGTDADGLRFQYRLPTVKRYDGGLEQHVAGGHTNNVAGAWTVVAPEFFWNGASATQVARDPVEPAQFTRLTQEPEFYEVLVSDPTDPSDPRFYRFEYNRASFGSDVQVFGVLRAPRVETDHLVATNFDLPAVVTFDEVLASILKIRRDDDSVAAIVTVTDDALGVDIDADYDLTVTGDVHCEGDGDWDHHVAGSYGLDVDGDIAFSCDNDLSMTCAGDATFDCDGAVTCDYGSLNQMVDGDAGISCGGAYSVQVQGDLSQACGGEMRLEANSLAAWTARDTWTVTVVASDDPDSVATLVVTPADATLDKDLVVEGSIHGMQVRATEIIADTASIGNIVFDSTALEHLEVGGTDPDRPALKVSHEPLAVAFACEVFGGNDALTYAWDFDADGDTLLQSRVTSPARYAYDGTLSQTANDRITLTVVVTDDAGEPTGASVSVVVTEDSLSSTVPVVAITDTLAPTVTAENTAGGAAVVATGNGATAPAIEARNTSGGPALYVPSGKVCFPGRTLTVPRQADSITITDPTIGPTTAVLANFIADTKGIGIAWVDVSAPGRAVLHFTRKLNEDTPILVILFDALPAA